jgi:hypothetical protein
MRSIDLIIHLRWQMTSPSAYGRGGCHHARTPHPSLVYKLQIDQLIQLIVSLSFILFLSFTLDCITAHQSYFRKFVGGNYFCKFVRNKKFQACAPAELWPGPPSPARARARAAGAVVDKTPSSALRAAAASIAGFEGRHAHIAPATTLAAAVCAGSPPRVCHHDSTPPMTIPTQFQVWKHQFRRNLSFLIASPGLIRFHGINSDRNG